MDTTPDAPSHDGGEPSARPVDAALAAAFERRRVTITERDAQLAVAARLAPLMHGHNDAAAALAAFEAEEVEAIRKWAAEPSDEPPPAPRADDRAALAEAFKTAQARAAAAQSASDAAGAEVLRLNRAIPPLNAAIAAAALPVLATEVDPIIERTRANIAQLEVDLGDLAGIASAMLAEADRAKDVGSPFAAEMSSSAVRVVQNVMFAKQLMDLVGLPPTAKAKWASFLADLKQENHDDYQ